MFAEAAIVLGDREASALFYRALLPYGDQIALLGTTCEGPLAHYLGGLAGVLECYGDAERHFARAAEWNAAASAPFMAARTHLHWARVLRARDDPGDDERAAVLSGRARGAAELGGFAGDLRQPDELTS